MKRQVRIGTVPFPKPAYCGTAATLPSLTITR